MEEALEFFLDRILTGPGSTLGELLVYPGEEDEEESVVRPARLCWMLEEPWRPVKVQGETCIPPGHYELELVHDSPLAIRYYERFDWFRGLLSIKDVPGFTAVRIHVGNDAVNPDDPTDQETDDTDGCPLPGLEREQLKTGDWRVLRSVEATKAFHERAYEGFDAGQRVFLEIADDKIQL